MIVAMMLPPNAGRVWCSRWLSLSIDSAVQSAVRPVRARTATLAKNARPTAVAPARMTSGLCLAISWLRASV